LPQINKRERFADKNNSHSTSILPSLEQRANQPRPRHGC
jgi:hypothetical protein